jgi:hypothetical protein
MANRMDVVVTRDYEDRSGAKKTKFTNIGVAFEMKNGGWAITLDALPVPTMGERGLETRMLLMVPREKDDGIQTSSGRHTPTGSRGGSRPMDDDGDSIPFSAPVL